MTAQPSSQAEREDVAREALAACPFCGGSNIAYVAGDGCEYTTCDDCLANGPVAATEAEAQAAWNRRPDREHATPSSMPEEVEYEVWQADALGDGEAMVAGSTDLADAQHYAAVYSQDGPAWVVEVTRRHLRDDAAPTDLPPLQDTGERE